MNDKLLEDYIRNIAQQEILKDKIKKCEMDIAFNKMQLEMEKALTAKLWKGKKQTWVMKINSLIIGVMNQLSKFQENN